MTESRWRIYWTNVSTKTKVWIGHAGTEWCVLGSTAPIPRYRQYHRPIDSPDYLGCNRSIAADSVRSATLKKRAWPHRSQRKTMSIIDKALEANRNYAKNYNPEAEPANRPAPKIVGCNLHGPSSPRTSPGILPGLPQADIDVIRTGGPAGNRRCTRGTCCFQPCTRNHQRYLLPATTPAAGSRHSPMTKFAEREAERF